MKSTKCLLLFLPFFLVLSGCHDDKTIDDEYIEVMDPAYEELLTSISCFEKENHFVVDAPTRRIKWGFVVAADAAPIIIFSGFGGIGVFTGTAFGIMNSFYLALLDRDVSYKKNYRNLNDNWENEVVKLKSLGVDNNEVIGTVHNAVLQELLQGCEIVDYSKNTDWELFKIIEEKVAKYLPEESTIHSEYQFQQMMKAFPDSRKYIDYASFEGACLNDYPEFKEEFTVALRVLGSIVAQDNEEQLDSYEKGVIQLIKDSSIPEASKKGLIGTVSVQKASREFWYE